MKRAKAFERRAFGRRRTNIRANVRIGYRVVTCTIKDISEGGALLEFDEHLELSARVWLSWPDQPNELVCEVRHSRNNSAGVQFVRPQALNLKPAVTPANAFKLIAIPVPREERPAASGKDLVAEYRRSLLHYSALAASNAAGAIGSSNTLQVPVPPRDLSGLRKRRSKRQLF
jgi:hypothetical protein